MTLRALTDGVVAAAMPAAAMPAAAIRHRAPRAVSAGLLVLAAACGGADPPAGDTGGLQIEAPAPAAVDARDAAPAESVSAAERPVLPEALASPAHQRFQQLRVETLRLMIAAAQRALPIGPFQDRIDTASRTAAQDVSAAADRMEEIVADLERALAAGG